MNTYKPISIADFMKLDMKKESQYQYELKGIPRAINTSDKESFALDFVLQEKNDLVIATIYRHQLNVELYTVPLLQAACEGNLEIMVRGTIDNPGLNKNPRHMMLPKRLNTLRVEYLNIGIYKIKAPD